MQTVVKILMVVAFLMGCNSQSDDSVRLSSNALLVLPGAEDVKKRENDDTIHIFYKLNKKYPAMETIELIENQLNAMGWTQLKHNELNLNAPTSLVTGWSVRSNPKKGTGNEVHSWDSIWKNEQGDYIKYFFQFNSPKGQIKEQELLWVAANLVPSKLAKKIKHKMGELQERKKRNR